MSNSKPYLQPEKAIKKVREAFPDLTAKIEASDIDVQLYITALEKDNLKMKRQIATQRSAYLLLEGEIQIRAEEEAARIIEESELIAQSEKEAAKYRKQL